MSQAEGLELIQKEGIWMRAGSGDEKAFTDVREQYNELKLYPDDVVLDLGAHIGCYICRYALPAGVKHIFGIEPEPSNFSLLVKNCGDEPNVTLHQVAVAVKKGMANFYPSRTKNTLSGHFRPTRGRQVIQVKCIAFKDMLAWCKPTVIKIDIEGTELELDLGYLPATVRALALEFHFPKPGELEIAEQLYSSIVDSGFEPSRELDFNDVGMINVRGNFMPRTILSTVFTRV